tara:strand:- start:2393 stop:3205 length:813 start_codon:yes stop_codon:yes gene_type:complete
MDLTKYEKTLLFIDSVDRDNGNMNDFTINIELPRHRIKLIEVHSVEIPQCIYPIRDNYNNTFKFIDTGSTTRTFDIIQGSYSINVLLSTLKTSMDTYGGTYTLSYSTITYKITIKENSNTNFSLIVSDKDNTLWKLLGFTGTSDLTGNYTYTASSIFNISQEPSYIYLKSSLIHASKDKIITANKTKKKSYVSCLCKIPLEVPFGEILHHRPYIPLRFSVEERSLSNMRFWLEDNNGNLLPMERDWSIGIILYASPDNFNFFDNGSNIND